MIEEMDNDIFLVVLGAFVGLAVGLIVWGTYKHFYEDKEKPETQLIQPPNYDKESLLELMEKGECVGGTIEEGKFSIFVCKN